MKMNPRDWIPFEHENIDYKQRVLQFARERDGNNLKDVLTAVLIYVNAVDYIASHLLTNLRKMSYFVLHEELNAQMFYENSRRTSDAPLHTQIERLRNYDFPDKNEFLRELTEFKELRNKYVHNFLKLTTQEIEKSGLELDSLYGLAESILTRYDNIVRGITDTWIAYRLRKINTPVPPSSAPAEPDTNPKPKAKKSSKR